MKSFVHTLHRVIQGNTIESANTVCKARQTPVVYSVHPDLRWKQMCIPYKADFATFCLVYVMKGTNFGHLQRKWLFCSQTRTDTL